ncbi:MAG: pyridoxal-dependent decarboxylase, exosortase A system-associated [Rhodocyclaceae bacterium]|nr:pyridoxal-dependent decarboxylase, exosortase A system-associated [Rhodocyclaceae bacterium]
MTSAFMCGFPVIDGELQVGGMPLTRLVAQVGRTPFYVYDRQRIAARIAELRAVLPAAIGLHYAVKANPFPPLLRFMADKVDGFDIASAGELALALDAGMDAARISFAGPGKQREELEQAVAAGVLLNAESPRELETLADIARRTGRRARAALRINPAFELKGAGMRMGGGSRPFGIDEEAVPALLADWSRLGDALAFEGFHIYAGSQNLDGTAIAATQRASYDLALRLAVSAPAPVQSLNLGGGFGIPYFPHEKPLDLAPVMATLRDIAAAAAKDLPRARLCLELGRYLVGEAGLYVTRVIDKKISRGQTYLVVDGGLHHHLAATGNLGQVIRRNFPVAIGTKVSARGTAPDTVSTTVVGPLCTPLDMLADRVDLPAADIGDLVVIFQSGAYGASASPQGFLSHPPVMEVLP